jgi:hypothetical protein
MAGGERADCCDGEDGGPRAQTRAKRSSAGKRREPPFGPAPSQALPTAHPYGHTSVGRWLVVRMSPEVVAVAKQLGHTSANITGPTRRGLYRVSCNCGYESRSRTSRALAFEALAHHLVMVTGAGLINGVSLPKAAGKV